MAEMPNIDPNFETQSRPRSDTWPMNRPNIPPRRRMPDISGTMLSTTLEENGTGGLMTIDATMMGLDPPPMKDDYLEILSPGSIPVPNDLDNILSGLPSAANLVEDYSLGSALIKNEPNNNSIMSEYCTQTTITELSNLSSDKGFDDIQSMQHQGLAGQLVSPTSQNFSPSTTTTGLPKSPTTSTTVSTPQSSTTSTAGTTPKAKSTRKNAWGNMSYADLITNAIESSPEKRLTLAQIYEWMVKNVNYFKDKGDSNSSAGWKNSIRHNLSLHAKFKRIQNEGTGKSSWWIINHDAKNAKSPRRRAISMDNQNSKHMRQRTKLARQRAEKQKASLKAGETSTWGRDGTSNLETTVSKAMGSEYRVRANSNASSVGGRLSPSHMFPPQDLDDEGPPPLSPLGSATNLANLSTSLPSAFDIFGRTDSTPCTITESTLPESMVQANLLENFAVMDVGSVSYTGEPVDTKPVLYMQQLNGAQQNQNRKNLTGNVAQNSPNLANLLKQSKSPPKTTTMTKIEPEWNDSKPAYGYEFQSPQMMSSVIQPSQPQFKTPIPPRYVLPQDSTQYSQNALQQQNPVQQQQVNYVQQQQFMANPQRQMVPGNPQQPPPQYPSDTNLIEMAEGNFPSDIDLNSQDLFDSGDLDMAEALRDNDFAYNNFGDINFGNMNQQQVFYNQSQLQGSTDYNMGGNTMMQQQQQPPPVMHANPDVFLANQGPGSTSMDMMMDGCRLNNNNFQRSMQTGQTSSVGAASKYSLQ